MLEAAGRTGGCSVTKETLILFSGEMIHAIIAGTKTQTRRAMKPQPSPAFLKRGLVDAVPQWPIQDGIRFFMADGCSELVSSKYGKPGGKLVFKESAWMFCEKVPNGKTPKGRDKWRYAPLKSAPVQYCADDPQKPTTDVVHEKTKNQWVWKFKSGRYLPRWACRLEAICTGIRIERLHCITEADAIAEGVRLNSTTHWATEARDAYRILWERINGVNSWKINPIVFVISFKRI